MKRILMFSLLVCSMLPLAAQTVSRSGAYYDGEETAIRRAETVVGVTVEIEKRTFTPGIYARYAQKYLGVRAALTDKTTWSIKSAHVALLDSEKCLRAEPLTPSASRVQQYADSRSEFARLQPDKLDMTTPTLEDAARAAAERIYSLRRHRLELITGEAGENVFGAGLEAALAKIDRMEQSYLELFLGKEVVTTSSRRFVVYPHADKKQYIVCRFSPAAGILPDSDLSGDIVLLQVEPSGASHSDIEARPKEQNVVTCRVADPVTCTVLSNGTEYVRAVLPIYEFGRTIRVALPKRK